MSDTLNRPMFKRGPDGQMRQAYQFGGGAGILKALPMMYKGAKYLAPKFTNLPYNINRMLAQRGIPTLTGKTRTTGVTNPYVGKTGPMSPNPKQSFDWRLNSWSDQFNSLKSKHGLSTAEAFGYKGVGKLPQEVIDHLKVMPKMPWGRTLTENAAYGFTGSTLNRWADHPDDPTKNVNPDVGAIAEDKPTTGQGIGAAGGPIPDEPEGPIVPGTNIPDEDPSLDRGDEYDGPGQTIGAAGGPIPDLVSEVVTADDTVSPKSIQDYKDELREVIGKEDSNMGSLMLMQLGLGMMAGKSMQPGFAGFAEILGKTGQQVLPMWMEHMQNKRKEDKEIALAAYDMLRTDRAAQTERKQGLEDWLWKKEKEWDVFVAKEEYKQPFAGDEGMIQVNHAMRTPDGTVVDNWRNLKQTYTKSPEALWIMQNSNPNQMRIINLSMTDAGGKAAGFGDMNLTDAQRGENVMLANVYERNLEQILSFLMDPEQGLHSGNFKTGTTGGIVKTLRFADREVQQIWNTIRGRSDVSHENKFMWGVLKNTESDMMKGVLQNQGLISGAGNAESIHGDSKDVIYGRYDDGYGNMIEGNYATEQFVRNLTDNSFYDIEDQIVNMMGFLEARLKQPTGRLLADTIKTSIDNLKKSGFMKGDPTQIANKMHFFVKRLYEAYATHSIKGGAVPKTRFEGGRGLIDLSIENYNRSYLGFAGDQALDQGISLGWMNQLPVENKQLQTGNAPGNIYPNKNEVPIHASEDFSGLMKYSSGDW